VASNICPLLHFEIKAHVEKENISFAPQHQIRALLGAQLEENARVVSTTTAASIGDIAHRREWRKCGSPAERALFWTLPRRFLPNHHWPSTVLTKLDVHLLLAVHFTNKVDRGFIYFALWTKWHTCCELTPRPRARDARHQPKRNRSSVPGSLLRVRCHCSFVSSFREHVRVPLSVPQATAACPWQESPR